LIKIFEFDFGSAITFSKQLNMQIIGYHRSGKQSKIK